MSGTVELYWLPLGAGGHFVRFNGRVYEAVKAWVEHRPRYDLYHGALRIRLDGIAYTIEQAPVPNSRGADRGVVASGPVGARWAGRFRVFRYEVRCWPGGEIPDIAEAVASPVSLSEEEACARRLLDTVPRVPTPVWGRDELRAGEMWNSNSVVAWVLARSGIDARSIRPPEGGRAPGWRAGLTVEARAGSPGTD